MMPLMSYQTLELKNDVTCEVVSLKWVNKLKILGVYFWNGLVNVKEDNWGPKLDKLTKDFVLWSQRDLSFFG